VAQTDEIARSDRKSFFELLTKEQEGTDVTIEVVGEDFGDQVEVERLPFAYIAYDDKDDVVIVAVGGVSSRYPVLLRHLIEHPQKIYSDGTVAEALTTIDIIGDDGAQTLVSFRPRLALPPA
jgi:hypothetical protein